MLRNRSLTIKNISTALQKHHLLINQACISENIKICKPETDSRKIQAGDIFICISGFQADGHDFIEQAKANGAALFITEREIPSLPQMIVTNGRKAAAVIADVFFETSSHQQKLIGITGTNGKTTTSIMLCEMLKAEGKRVGLIGTLGYKIMDESFPLQHTTPDILELHSILKEMNDGVIEFVVMEVSSHALALDRVYGLQFNCAIFTNLTHDHLDFHQSLEDYASAKHKLFEQISDSGIAIINTDDECGREFYQKITKSKIGLSSQKGDAVFSSISLSALQTNFSLNYNNFQNNFEIPFIGNHNIYNFCSAYLAFVSILPDYEKDDFHFSQDMIVPGRLEVVRNAKKLAIYVDYAHTPDALENVLKTLKPLTEGRLLCVFGAGGNRDKLKRPKMLQKSLEHADYTFITSDNPRFEKEEDIIRDIVQNANFIQPFWIERNRKKAIEIAVSLMTEKDILLIAGKGHETYQIIGDKKIHFDDKEKALEAIIRKQDSIDDLLAIPIDPLNLELLFHQKVETFSTSLTNISTDSRKCKPNSIFFALKGERFDGHDYIDKVLHIENCIAIVEKNFSKPQQNLIVVDDTTKAYGTLAKKYQSLFPVLKIAITGSMGKTTTKEYLYRVLSDQKPTLKTLENENNQIGLPKTIFRLQPNHRFAIFELGSNHFGEIAYLTDICQPDYGIVTNIGSVHTEFFGDENGVFKEKSSLLIGAKRKIFFPKDDKRFHIFQGIGFGTSLNCNYRIHTIQNEENNITFYVNDDFYQIQTVFKENVFNALAAISIARELQISASDIQKSLAPSISIPLRMQLIKKDGILFLADCYNANPHSMLAAIDTWQSMQPEKPHIAILGDMLELGKEAKQHHLKIAEKLKKCNAKIFVAIGELAKDYNADYYFATVYDFLKADFTSNFPKESIVLVKASHGIHLEKIVEG